VRAAEEEAIDEALGCSFSADQLAAKLLGASGVEDVGNFFKSVAAVSRAEEVLVAQHREAVEADELLLEQERTMLADLQQPDGCSVDEYAGALEKVLAAKQRIVSELQGRLDALKEMMAREEALSATVKQVPLL
jgi:vacuolar-type H+-ATPase subunit I/STV1